MKKDSMIVPSVIATGHEVSESNYSEDKNDRKSHDASPFGPAQLETGEIVEAQESTQRGLKSRHAQMIALGGTIGTGLFVGSGATLARGGPLFILMCYIIIAILVLFIVTAVTEIAAYLPTAGGTMSYFGFRYVSSSMGFAMGWLYW